MTLLGWMMLALGFLAGGLVGFLVGRYTAASATIAGAAARIDAIDKNASAARKAIDAETQRVLTETPNLSGKDLQDAINGDYSRPLPGVQPDAPAGAGGKDPGK